MKKNIKKLWVKALRSGKYKQGRGMLKTSRRGYCCLGVLTDLYAKSKGKNLEDIAYPGSAYPPASVLKWADLSVENPEVFYSGKDCTHTSLVNLNDSKKRDFNFIADSIAKNL